MRRPRQTAVKKKTCPNVWRKRKEIRTVHRRLINNILLLLLYVYLKRIYDEDGDIT